MKHRNRLLAAMAGGVMLLATAIPASTAMAEPTRIRVGYSVVPVHMAPLIFKRAELATHQGKSYTSEFIHFRGSAAQLTAMAAKELDLAVLAFSTFAAGIVNARQDLRAVADVARDGPGFSSVFGVLDKSPIRKITDLKGKVLAINGKGGAVDMAARTVMLQNGLKPGVDVTIVEARFGAMEAMLRQGKTHVSVFVAPFWARAQKKGGIRSLFTQRDGLGTTQFLFYAAKKEFVDKNRAALVDWLEDYVRGIKWMTSPANRDKALDMAAAYTKRKRGAFAGWAFTKSGDYYHDPDGRLDLPALQRNVDTLNKLGILRRSFDVNKYVDESLVKEAGARLK